MERHSVGRFAERVLLAIGLLLLGTALFQIARYRIFQSHPDWFLSPTTQVRLEPSYAGPGNYLDSGPGGPARAVEKRLRKITMLASRGQVQLAGKLEIPRLGLSELVLEGDDSQSLSLAAEHLPESAALGESGNAVIAGHREMAFRALRDIKVGDEVRIETAKTYIYRVESIRIVKPDNVSVLAGGAQPMLTLITCYPFYYIGNAPRRYVVQARLTQH